MNSVKLSGEQYYKLAESFIAALNSDNGIMQYQSAWKSLCVSECDKAAQEASIIYKIEMTMIWVPDENTAQMDLSFKNASEEALSVFRRMTVGFEQSEKMALLVS